MLRGAAGVVSLRSNKDSFNEVEASLADCMEEDYPCEIPDMLFDCCEYT